MMRFRQLFTEISQREIDKIPNDIEDLLTKKKLPFNHIFGDKLRLAEPLNSGIEHSVKSNLGHDDFHYDFDKWQVYKATDLNKKNPIRIGRAFSLKQQALLKALKNPELSEEDRKNYQSQLDSITQLLKASDLQKQYKNSQEDKYVIIYSRAPIDVLRMGDFQWSTYSCHSPSGSYYYCALADAMLNAGIIYLIRASDYQWLLHNNALQNKEIFHDDDRNVWGIKPLARMRIRMVVDENGEELAVPTLKIYSVTGHVNNDAFKKQVSAWAKRQDTNDFGWEDALTLRGGTYEDAGHTIANEVKKIWGRVISYSNDPEQEDEAAHAHAEELFWDEVKQLISDSESELVSWIFGNDIANKDQIIINTNGYDTFEIDFDETGYIRKIFDRFLQGDRTSLRRIEKNGVSLFCKNSFKGIILKLHNFHIHFLEGAYFYTEYDNHYDKEELFNSIEQMVRKAVNDLVGYINWPDVSDPIGLYDLKIKLYNALLKANGMPEIEIDFDDLEELNDNNYSVVLGKFDTPKNPKLDITNLVIDDVGFRNKLILLLKHWHRVLAYRVLTAYKLPILGKKGLTSEFEIDFGAGYTEKRRSKMEFYDPIASYLLGYIQFDNSKTSLKMRFDIWDSISKIIYYNYGNDGKISLKPYINLIKDREDIDFSDFKKSLQNFMDDWASKNPDQLELDLSSFKQFFKFLV